MQVYRVLKKWSDKNTQKQLASYQYSDSNLQKAKALVDKNPGYLVFSDGGIPMYPLPFEICPTVSLAIFGGWESDAKKTGSTGKAGTFQVTAVKNSRGKLKSGAGWVALKNLPVQTIQKVKPVDYLAAAAKQAPIVYDKIVSLGCKHKSGTKTWEALAKNKYVNCASSASLVLQRAGVLKKGCIVNHRSGVGNSKAVSKKNAISKAMAGQSNLITGRYTIVKIGKTYSKMSSKYKKAGIVYVQDSNICVCAGGGYIYSCNEAKSQMSGGKYKKTKVKSGYPFSSPILYAIVPKSD